MWRSLSLSVLRQLLKYSAAAFLISISLVTPLAAHPQHLRPQEDLQGVLSRRPLNPPLRNAKVTLRYSPNGRSLAIQNPSGIYLFSRDPFRLQTY
ncbi:MAG: hypothetical protein ACRD51_18735, partial [Candidatus Acidiferrum sp.]